jgi:hypothetical protein
MKKSGTRILEGLVATTLYREDKDPGLSGFIVKMSYSLPSVDGSKEAEISIGQCNSAEEARTMALIQADAQGWMNVSVTDVRIIPNTGGDNRDDLGSGKPPAGQPVDPNKGLVDPSQVTSMTTGSNAV